METKDNNCYVVLSPLASIRFRRGGILLTSPLSAQVVRLDMGMLEIVGSLFRPRKRTEVLSAIDALDSGVSSSGFLKMLIEHGSVISLDSLRNEREGNDDEFWWDPSDAAYFDMRQHQCLQILSGWTQSLATGMPVDRHNEPVPWFSLPFIQFLDSLDLTNSSLLEWGSGNSSLYWAQRAREVLAVEHNPYWSDKLLSRRIPNLSVICEPRLDLFPSVISRLADSVWDVIVIDGHPSTREKCARLAARHLSPEGFIILDDSTYYPSAARILRENGMLEIDFSGPAVLEDNLQTTSLFLRRSTILRYRFEKLHPRRLDGGPGFDWAPFQI